MINETLGADHLLPVPVKDITSHCMQVYLLNIIFIKYWEFI